MAPTLPIPIPIFVSSSSDDDDEKEAIVVSTDDGSDGDGTHASKRRRRACGNDGRNPAYEVWLFHEEVTMLTAMGEHRRQTGKLPKAAAILRALQADQEGLRWRRRKPMSTRDVGKKVLTLRDRYKRSVRGKKALRGGDIRSKKLDELSKEVWPDMASLPASSPADEQAMICSSSSPDEVDDDSISCSSSSSSEEAEG